MFRSFSQREFAVPQAITLEENNIVTMWKALSRSNQVSRGSRAIKISITNISSETQVALLTSSLIHVRVYPQAHLCFAIHLHGYKHAKHESLLVMKYKQLRHTLLCYGNGSMIPTLAWIHRWNNIKATITTPWDSRLLVVIRRSGVSIDIGFSLGSSFAFWSVELSLFFAPAYRVADT